MENITTISELLAELEAIKNEYGDIPVVIGEYDDGWNVEHPTKKDLRDFIMVKPKSKNPLLQPPYFRIAYLH